MSKRNRKRSLAARRKARRLVEERRPPPGSMPGTLELDPEAFPPELRVIAYGPDGYSETEPTSVEDVVPLLEGWPVVWVNVDGLGSETTIRRLGELFGLHRLVLEDIVHTGQRAKVEPYPEYLYVVARQPSGSDGDTEQLSLVLNTGTVLTFQERAGDVFEAVRERIRHGRGLIRGRKADYLAYALLDATIDGYFPVLEQLGERIEQIEEAVFMRPSDTVVEEIHDTRRELIRLRKAAWPHRDMLNSLIRDASRFISDETLLHLRDTYDHAIRIVDLIETLRELTSDLMSVWMSNVSNRMNEVMRVLTVMASIFIPLSFIAGVYGMNFDPSASGWNMPELGWPLGYPFALLLMAFVAGGLLWYFRRKGWLD